MNSPGSYPGINKTTGINPVRVEYILLSRWFNPYRVGTALNRFQPVAPAAIHIQPLRGVSRSPKIRDDSCLPPDFFTFLIAFFWVRLALAGGYQIL